MLTLLLLLSPLFLRAEDIDCRGGRCQCIKPGPCQIFCDGSTDQCKSSSLHCMPGFPCTVYCAGKTVCTDARIQSNGATDVNLLCDGKDACKSSSFRCGSGLCTIDCVSRTDCEDIKISGIDGANGFECTGQCNGGSIPKPKTPKPTDRPTQMPTQPTMTPTRAPTLRPTRAPIDPQTIACSGIGQVCECDGTRPCVINCLDTDACMDSALICSPGFECDITCDGTASCSKAIIIGPTGENFNLNCGGIASCGSASVESDFAADVRYQCSGKDSCKGAGTSIACGSGLCTLQFTGEASGDSASIATNTALGFQCEGRYAPCPPNYAPPCPGLGAAACVEGVHYFNEYSCECECPLNKDGVCAVGETFNARTCECEVVCPAGSPTAAECSSRGLVRRDGECGCFESANCCLTSPSQTDPKQWAGLCWGETMRMFCEGQPNQRCVWDTKNCLPDPPVNVLNPGKACGFAEAPCASDADCCSELCRVDGLCR